MINDNNKLHFLLGVLVTSLSIVLYKEVIYKSPVLQTKTETIVRMVDDPFIRDFRKVTADLDEIIPKCEE